MPKKKGNKRKNKKKGNNNDVKRPLILAGDLEEYGKIIKLLGDRRVRLLLTDNSEILGHIPGRFRKKVWMKLNDIVLVSRRDFQTNKTDILHKYTESECRKLYKQTEIPESFLYDENDGDMNEEMGIIINRELEGENDTEEKTAKQEGKNSALEFDGFDFGAV